MHASDLAKAIKFIIDSYEKVPDLVNVGVGYDLTINGYYELVAAIAGFSGDFCHLYDKPVGMKRKLLDNSLLCSFGWSPSVSLEAGLKSTALIIHSHYENGTSLSCFLNLGS